MGNSPSSAKHPKPERRSLEPSAPRSSNTRATRRLSAQPPVRAQGDSLSVPPSGHRRTRSASAIRALADAPPPYSPTAEPGTQLTQATSTRSPGSSHTQVVTEAARRGSTNPFRAGTGSARPDLVVETRRDADLPTVPHRRNNSYSEEDALQMLKKYDTLIVVDDSSSMAGERWRETKAALAQLAEIAARYDADGVDICFLNSNKIGSGLKRKVDVERLFDRVAPYGVTPIGEKLEALLLEYLLRIETAKDQYEAGIANAMKSVKPINFIVLTDGAPTDDPETVIVTAAKRLDARNFPLTQVGIQFVQIGNQPDARAFLQELDDGLVSNHAVRDMVDTTPYNGMLDAEALTKVLLGGINRRVDRRGGSSVM